jgi:putative spermidine/putrescine transport system permease protein
MMARLAGPILAAPVTVWLCLTFLAPLVVVAALSLHEYADPFGPIFVPPTLYQFRDVLGDAFYLGIIARTLALGAVVTLVTVLLGYPLALLLARAPANRRPLLFAIILIPLLTNVVVRSLGIVLLLAPDGLLNQALGLVGIGPFGGMLYNFGAVTVALAQVFMPFMVLALYDVLQSTSPRVHEAAENLGASPAMRFVTIDLPLSLTGLRAGIIIVFILASTAYVSASMLGGGRVMTTGMLVFQEAMQNLNAPFAAAMSIVMTVTSILAAVLVAVVIARLTPWLANRPAEPRTLPRPLVLVIEILGPIIGRLLLLAALLLLLLPLALVCIQSFNDVPQATVAGFRAFTLRWYDAVLFGGAYGTSFWVSVQVAAVSAAVALALALPAAFALARYRFWGLAALAAFWALPLSLPHVAIGVGMLRILQAFVMLPPFMGLVAVHVVLILPFAIALLVASVMTLDRAQEEAAASLGAGAVRCFLLITLPALAPGMAAAGIMAFLLSFGEVTVTSFLTTARLTTLPVRIYAEASFSLEPTVHAVSALLIMITVGVLFILNRLMPLDRLYAR